MKPIATVLALLSALIEWPAIAEKPKSDPPVAERQSDPPRPSKMSREDALDIALQVSENMRLQQIIKEAQEDQKKTAQALDDLLAKHGIRRDELLQGRVSFDPKNCTGKPAMCEITRREQPVAQAPEKPKR